MCEPPFPERTRAAQRFLSALVAYAVVCVVGFVVIASKYGLRPSLALSLIAIAPVLIGLRIHRRWESVRSQEFVFLAILWVICIGGVTLITRAWDEGGFYGTVFATPTEEDSNWKRFKNELRRDAAFRDLTIEHFRGVSWVKGSLGSEADLERLVSSPDPIRLARMVNEIGS